MLGSPWPLSFSESQTLTFGFRQNFPLLQPLTVFVAHSSSASACGMSQLGHRIRYLESPKSGMANPAFRSYFHMLAFARQMPIVQPPITWFISIQIPQVPCWAGNQHTLFNVDVRFCVRDSRGNIAKILSSHSCPQQNLTWKAGFRAPAMLAQQIHPYVIGKDHL